MRKAKARKSKRSKRGSAKKFKTIVAVIIELLIMTVKVLSCLLPLYWQFGILIAAGARSIILQAIRKRKALPPNVKGHKVLIAVITELVIMVAEILCCLLPMPWRLVVPIIIGARAIILRAIRNYREPQRCSCGATLPNKAGKKK